MKYILTDIDNTLVRFSPHFEDWAERYGHSITRGVIENTYDFQQMFRDPIPDPEAMLQPFFACDMTMSTFPALDNCVEPVQRLHQAGYRFIAVTACTPRDGLAQIRKRNLEEVYGIEFEDVFISGYERPKAEVLKHFGPSVWVEDNLKHAREGAELGHRTFVIDYTYNQGTGPFERVKDWRCIERALWDTDDSQ